MSEPTLTEMHELRKIGPWLRLMAALLDADPKNTETVIESMRAESDRLAALSPVSPHPDTRPICGCGYRMSLHASDPHRSTYCELAEARSRAEAGTPQEEVAEAGALLYALCAVADECGATLTLRRSPHGALVIFAGDPERYLAEDADETAALRKAHAAFDPWITSEAGTRKRHRSEGVENAQ